MAAVFRVGDLFGDPGRAGGTGLPAQRGAGGLGGPGNVIRRRLLASHQSVGCVKRTVTGSWGLRLGSSVLLRERRRPKTQDLRPGTGAFHAPYNTALTRSVRTTFYSLLFGQAGGPGRRTGCSRSSFWITSIAFSNWSSVPSNSRAGSLSTTMSGSTPCPSMIQCSPSLS
jgi:hypothetical protein